MPIRRHTDTNIDAAIERRLNQLRQIPARIEAEQLIAKKFAEAGRPLGTDRNDVVRRDQQSVGVANGESEPHPFSLQFRTAFVLGAAIAGSLAAAIWIVFG